MAKNSVTDWSTNDSLNTDIGSTNIAEGCAPGGINDAIRKIMSQVATYITSALFTVVQFGDAAFKAYLSSGNPRLEFDSTDYLGYDRSGNALTAVIGGTTLLTLSGAGITFAGVASSNTYIRAGAIGAAGSARLSPGDATHSGLVEFLDTAGTSIGTIQQTISGGLVSYISGANGHNFSGGPLTAASNIIGAAGLLVTGATNPVGVGARIEYGGGRATLGGFDYGAGIHKGVDVNGSTIRLQTGAAGTATTRLTVSDTAVTSTVGILSAATVEGTTPGTGTTGGLRTRGSAGGSGAIVQFTNNDSTNEWVSIIADPAGNKVTIVVGHVAVFSIDSSGNVKALGTITASTAP